MRPLADLDGQFLKETDRTRKQLSGSKKNLAFRILIYILLLLATRNLVAQQADSVKAPVFQTLTTVYLTNGSKLLGYIERYTIGDTLVLVSMNYNTRIAIPESRIQKVEQKVLDLKTRSLRAPIHREQQLVYRVGLHVLAGRDRFNEPHMGKGISLQSQYRWSRWLTLGLETGVDHYGAVQDVYANPLPSIYVIPFGLLYEAKLAGKRNELLFRAASGYSLVQSNGTNQYWGWSVPASFKTSGGFYGRPEMALRIHMGPAADLRLGAGLQFQSYRETQIYADDSNARVERQWWLRRWRLHLAFEFR